MSILSKLSGSNPIRNGIIHGTFIGTIFVLLLFAFSKSAQADELFATTDFRTVDHPIVTWYKPTNATVLNCLFVSGEDGNGITGSSRMVISSRLRLLSLADDSCQYFKGTYNKATGDLIIFNINNAGSAWLRIDEQHRFILKTYNIW